MYFSTYACFLYFLGFGEQQTKEELTISLALVPKNGHTQWQKGALLQEPKDEFNSTDLLMSTEALDRFEKKYI